MPLGVISDSEFDADLNHLKIPSSSLVEQIEQSEPDRLEEKVIDIKRGRGQVNEVPEALRGLIATESLSGAKAKLLAQTFGVSESSISAYKNGATSTTTYHKPDSKLEKAITDHREAIIGPATAKLMAAINAITEEKLEGAKVRDVAGVASSMSQVIKNMTPDSGGLVNNQQVIIFKPRMREEDEYETIEVNN